MLTAIKEYLPVFRKYLRKKGELLGHKNGLPWYDLFAPIGKVEKSYSIDEAEEYLVNCFSGFTPGMASLMKEAFENSWIDFYPRKGKEGGAFCADANFIRQSRILTNYDGTFGAVDTLAHELVTHTTTDSLRMSIYLIREHLCSLQRQLRPSMKYF